MYAIGHGWEEGGCYRVVDLRELACAQAPFVYNELRNGKMIFQWIEKN